MMKPTPWRIGRLFLVAWILGAVASCKGSEEITKAEIPATPDETVDDLEELPEWQALGDEDYAVVRVFYGTDRNDTGDDDPADRFGPERGSFAYGSCDVSIPRDHRMGELEEPVIFKFLADPSKHVVLLDVDRVDADSFFVRVSRRIDRSSTREAFVFVHGYNVTFEDAARRTAQMSYDLAFDGAPIFYSWPSAGSLDGYARDESNIEWTTPHLREFLSDLALRSGAESIHLIAHSMGNRGLTRALADLAGTEARARFEEIILTAPDVDAEIFTRDILPRMRAEGSRITLYASAKDKALSASKQVHGQARLGDAGEELVVADGMETVDATSVTTGFLGHSYYAESRSLISDLFYLLRERRPASERFALVPVEGSAGIYYRFK